MYIISFTSDSDVQENIGIIIQPPKPIKIHMYLLFVPV
jgi:hypothetical protein